MSFFDRLKFRTRPVQTVRQARPARMEPVRDEVRERPGNWVAENELADGLARRGKIDEAVVHLCALGDRLAADGFFPRAHAIYKKALRLQPDNAHAAQRAAEVGAERIQQTGPRLPSMADDPGPLEADPPPADPVAPATEAVAAAARAVAPPAEQVAAAAGAVAPTAEQVASAAAGAGHEEDHASEPTRAPVEALTATAERSADAAESTDAVTTGSPKTVAEILQDATFAAAYGDVHAAVRMLMDCAIAHPGLMEPVAALIEIAGRNGLEDVLANAEARLCDLYCQHDEFESARSVAAGLAARHPDDARHAARLSFIESALEERAASLPSAAEPAMVPSSDANDTPAHVTIDVDAAGRNAFQADPRAALELAADDEQRRFTACRELSRLDAEAGEWMSALAWLERAATAIPDSAAETDLAYEIALVFEGAGDRDRAVGVLSEVAAKAGAQYRDVADRIRRLTARADSPPREQLVAY